MNTILQAIESSISNADHWYPILLWASLFTLVLYTSVKLADVILAVARAVSVPVVFLFRAVWLTLQIFGLKTKVGVFFFLAKLAGEKARKKVVPKEPTGSVVKL